MASKLLFIIGRWSERRRFIGFLLLLMCFTFSLSALIRLLFTTIPPIRQDADDGVNEQLHANQNTGKVHVQELRHREHIISNLKSPKKQDTDDGVNEQLLANQHTDKVHVQELHHREHIISNLKSPKKQDTDDGVNEQLHANQDTDKVHVQKLHHREHIISNLKLPKKQELETEDSVSNSRFLDNFKFAEQFAYQLPLETVSFCSSRFMSIGDEFARLEGVVIDRRKCRCDRLGGEPIQDVLNQDESAEYYRMLAGCFRLDGCNEAEAGRSLQFYSFSGSKNHLNDWMRGLVSNIAGTMAVVGVAERSKGHQETVSRRREFTIAVQRYEYVNLYHTMTDWYNAFLLSRVYFNHINPARDVNILWVDAHPIGSLDPVWSVLFKSAYRLSELPVGETYFDDLVWGWQGYRSPLFVRSPSSPPPPLIEEFRDYFLSSYNIESSRRNASCFGEGRPSVLFLWRHNYMAHPRNPSGNIMRKISNENQIINDVRKHFPLMHVRGMQLDNLTMSEQLQTIVDTDILIGMHGAGLTHSLFLPRQSTLIELTPSSYVSSDHFAALASWRHLHYERWLGADFNDRSTVVRPSVVRTLIVKAIRRACPAHRATQLGV